MVSRCNTADGRPAARPKGAPQAARLYVTALGKGAAIPYAPCLDPNRLWSSVCGFIYVVVSMPAHVRTALTATSLSIPVHQGKMTLGIWQGIYLYEHRQHPSTRRIIVHLSGC